MMEYQTRYIAYAKHHGRSPDDQMAADELRFKGGCMAGFIAWISQMWAKWWTEAGRDAGLSRTIHGPAEHAHFDRWLNGVQGGP